VFGEFTPDYLLLIVAINNSKVAGIPISGDLGLFVRWAGDAAFALSVGGFFPKYKAPPSWPTCAASRSTSRPAAASG
jgi:hypothetical protein